MEKKDFQKELHKFMEQAKISFSKLSKDAAVFAKKGEKELVKASKIGKFQFDIMALNMQKEKLIYSIGKKVVSLRGKEGGFENAVRPLLKKYRKIETDVRGKKRDIGFQKKAGKAKK